MKNKWIVKKKGILMMVFLKRVISYNKKQFRTTIIGDEAHRYSSEENANKASIAFKGFVEVVIEKD